MKIRRPGFTLIEGLLALAVFLLALGLLSSLLSDFASFQRRFFRGDGEVVQTPEILSGVASDLWAASNILVPNDTTVQPRVRLELVDPTAFYARSNRPSDVPAAPFYWQPSAVAVSVVEYSRDAAAGTLTRTGLGPAIDMGHDIVDFESARIENAGVVVYRLTLTVQDGSRTKDWETGVTKFRAW